MSATDPLSAYAAEVERDLVVCNACRYCEGLCAVFPAMELRRTFTSGELDYLSNLCHNCGACYYDCQYAPPHELAINLPQAMAGLREETYARYAWPGALGPIFERNGVWLATLAALFVAVFIGGFMAWKDPAVLFATHVGEGAFYRIMPHNAMALIFGGAFLFAILATALSVRKFWRAGGPVSGLSLAALGRAFHDAATLRYLDGGGMGCMNEDDRPEEKRRLYHHFTFYGFMLCFASTSLATLFHYAGVEAPYPLWHPVVLLGTAGGIGLVVGPLGLLATRARRDPAIASPSSGRGSRDMGTAFILMLVATSATGLLLLALRSTPAMGVMLALHLGVVFAFFLTLPYSKFVHGLYRTAALVRHAHEQRMAHGAPARPEPAPPVRRAA
ncbi:tricarballylate utilization 4Fe-4S protein TcuB [Acuticoccus sediminis]|uniref:Tricarballylate utilization 4Fe-4S protein TcuB n=1 Tax=Acuticoccus sediminis TaxID=2184697 RepID=A0A8B2NUD4_9HYPH|nr:tricarballylate utilization 4Fe-4S protein TcuB [Acuticoccus sediminis]RAI01888.1 tricarballylate utilization 4Fe-4S protein TcuB [Acuticoccus sediminis]